MAHKRPTLGTCHAIESVHVLAGFSIEQRETEAQEFLPLFVFLLGFRLGKEGKGPASVASSAL